MALGLASSAGSAIAQVAGQAGTPATYVLDVSVNDWPLGLVARFWERGAGVCVLAAEYEGLGFELEESFVSTTSGVREVCLENVPGLTWRLDTRTQTININAPYERLQRTRLSVAPRVARIETQAGFGGVLAYDTYGEYAFDPEDFYHGRFLSTNLQARLYTPAFTAETTGYVTLSEGAEPSLVRLDTWVDFDNTDRAERLRIGDSYTSGLEWVQPVRFAGVHWGTDFSLRPDIVTIPTLTFNENIGTPSTIDLYINGVHRFSDATPPGAFELADLPTLVGANRLRVVVTEQGGRRRVTEMPLYTATRILAPGLSEYNVFAGAAREDYGIRSNEYGDLFASGNFRRGFDGGFTLAGELNAASDYVSTSFGGSTIIANQFLAFGGVSVSNTPLGTGLAWLASLERTGQWTNFAILYEKADNTYRDLAGRLGYGHPVERGILTAGATMGWAGNLNLSYAVQRSLFQKRTEVASMSYSLDMFDRRLTLMASGYSDLTGENWGGTVSLIFPLGRNARGNIDANRSQSDSYNSVQAHGDAFDQRLNWSVVAAEGQFNGGYVRADWRGRYIDLTGRAVNLNGSNSIDASAAQSFVFMPEGMFVAGRIDDAFTLVKVGDFPDVEVFLENRPVGRTNRQGNLLVTGLDSYVGNALSIDPSGLPMDVSPERTTALVAPRFGAGLVTRFGILEDRALLISLRLPDGGSPPVGAVAALAGSDVAAPVGFDGDVYLRGVSTKENRIQVTWPGGSCTAVVSGAVEPGRLRKTGAVPCAP